MSFDYHSYQSDVALIVNHSELVRRAMELGFSRPVHAKNGVLTEEQLVELRESGRCAAVVMFDPNDVDAGDYAVQQLKQKSIPTVHYDFTISLPEDPASLDDAVRDFPSIEFISKTLIDRGFMKDRNYTDRCGNCHYLLKPGDKYCRKCGTERGKGAFEPFLNQMDVVYGPPIKSKYKCKACGHIWISSVLGGDRTDYCPECGEKTAELVRQEVGRFFRPFGEGQPFEEDKRPILFEKDQVERLLSFRPELNYGGMYSGEEQLLLIREAGVQIPDSVDVETYCRTEYGDEQIRLAAKILCTQGNLTHAVMETCPNCDSSYVALYVESEKLIPSIISENGVYLVCEDGWEHGGNSCFCMQCGKSFSRRRRSKIMDLKQKGKLAVQKTVEEIKKAGETAANTAADAGEALSEKIKLIRKDRKQSEEQAHVTPSKGLGLIKATDQSISNVSDDELKAIMEVRKRYTPEERVRLIRGLLYIAACDGEVSPLEKEVVNSTAFTLGIDTNTIANLENETLSMTPSDIFGEFKGAKIKESIFYELISLTYLKGYQTATEEEALKAVAQTMSFSEKKMMKMLEDGYFSSQGIEKQSGSMPVAAKIGLSAGAVVVGAAALVLSAGAAAPAIGAALGEATGLYGAAAVSHGLALIGGAVVGTPTVAAGTAAIMTAAGVAGAGTGALGVAVAGNLANAHDKRKLKAYVVKQMKDQKTEQEITENLMKAIEVQKERISALERAHACRRDIEYVQKSVENLTAQKEVISDMFGEQNGK